MLNVTGINHFYYVCDFTDISCKHNCVLSITLELSGRDVFIVLSGDYRLVIRLSIITVRTVCMRRSS